VQLWRCAACKRTFTPGSVALERVLGYLEFRKQLLTGDVAEFTCLVGTMVQETFDSSPAIQSACEASISRHAAKNKWACGKDRD
jgi:TetR/AcrR family transcriptional repressor of nem operon